MHTVVLCVHHLNSVSFHFDKPPMIFSPLLFTAMVALIFFEKLQQQMVETGLDFMFFIR